MILSFCPGLTLPIRRWWLDRRIQRLTLERATVEEHLVDAEGDLRRQLPQEILCDIQSDVVDLRARRADLSALLEATRNRRATLST